MSLWWVVGVCIWYATVVAVTNRGFVSAPFRRWLAVQAQMCMGRAAILNSEPQPHEARRATIVTAIEDSLIDISRTPTGFRSIVAPSENRRTDIDAGAASGPGIGTRPGAGTGRKNAGDTGDQNGGGTTRNRVTWRTRVRSCLVWVTTPVKWMFNSPLTGLSADLVMINAANRHLMWLLNDNELKVYGVSIAGELAALDDAASKRLLAVTSSSETSADSVRLACYLAQLKIDQRGEQNLINNFNRQRSAFWLTLIGLAAIIGISAVQEYEVLLLAGAIGGFLAPTVGTLVSSDHESSWGEMVLSPVGGALTAVGGLLFVTFLASPLNILGDSFATLWSAPFSTTTLAVALLLGFSGRTFSQMAITAGTYLGPKAAVSA